MVFCEVIYGTFRPKLEESSFCNYPLVALLLFQQSILLLVCQFIFFGLIVRVLRFKNGFVVFCSSCCSFARGDFKASPTILLLSAFDVIISCKISFYFQDTFGEPIYFYFNSLTMFPSLSRDAFCKGFLSSSCICLCCIGDFSDFLMFDLLLPSTLSLLVTSFCALRLGS